ncbi:MAG: SCO family protein [Gemmatimonadota bacterium]|nr:SCO family protein [Gemmatimonadota bacterium]
MRRRAALALVALGCITAITVSWWALALWPMPATTPLWLARAREVCFGNAGDGLPNAGGWILLVGEPLGMVAILLAVWGDAVREGLGVLSRRWTGRLLLGGTAAGMLVGMRWAAQRVLDARGEPFDALASAPVRLDREPPPLRLLDQAGDTIRLEQYIGRPVVVAFVYGHCETVCPVIVHDLIAVTSRLGAKAPELLFVTLDPWRDTPARLATIAATWELPAGAHLLSAGVPQVEAVLDAWGVARSRNTTTGEIVHPRLAYLIGASGRITARLDGSTESVVAAVEALDQHSPR